MIYDFAEALAEQYRVAAMDMQSCAEGHNWRTFASEKMRVPSGWSRTEFEKQYREMADLQLRWGASDRIFHGWIMQVPTLVAFAVVATVASIYTDGWMSGVITTALATAAFLVPNLIFLLVQYAKDEPPSLFAVRCYLLALAFGSAWAIVRLASPPDPQQWAVALAAAILGNIALNLGATFLSTAHQRHRVLQASRNLDAMLVRDLSFAYHLLKLHLDGPPHKMAASTLADLASLIRVWLPTYLASRQVTGDAFRKRALRLSA